MPQRTDDPDLQRGLVWRDASLPLLRDRWFLAALGLFLVDLAGSAWQHHVWGIATSPLPFVVLAWWREDARRVAAWRGRRRARAGASPDAGPRSGRDGAVPRQGSAP